MAKRELTGKRAIVTGASSGIGWHLTLELCRQGVDVVACARRLEKLDELAASIASRNLPGQCHIVVCDVTDPVSRQQLLTECQERWDGIDVLINNAGTTAMGPFLDAAPDRLRRIFEVNFFALAELIRESYQMLRSGNRPIIVNVSSVVGHRAVPHKSEYSASKFAVHGFSDALRSELVEDGIDVLIVSPSTTDSEFFENSIEDSTGTDWKARGAMAPEKVAKKTVAAIRRGKHEIILTAGGKFLVWLDRLCPPLANWIVARCGK